MTKENDSITPQARVNHTTQDKYGKKYLEASEKMHQNVAAIQSQKWQEKKEEKKGPAGGFDDTPIPSAPAGYTVKFTFHKATNLPFADFNSLSSDPYLVATLRTDLQKRHKQDPDMTWRTPTIRRNVNPEWNSEWIVANVPASGFDMKCRLYDEDPADHDDRLGNVSVRINRISEDWSGIDRMAYKVKKRMGSKRAYFFRGCASILRGGHLEMSGEVIISAKVLGRTQSDLGGHIYTIGPCQWSKHFSPTIGRLAGTKDTEDDTSGNKVERYNFQAVQIQLAGPVPAELYHRYVEFKPFVAGMFGSKGLRGKVLNHALHHQHARIYNYDRSTVYGQFEEPCVELTRQFLDFVHYDQGGRIFTYVLTLDGQLRFTETGKEFGIDLLSKHTMHSNVASYIACSGEFFIRRLKHPHRTQDRSPDAEQADLPPAPEPDQEEDADNIEEPPKDTSFYELIIDNDSGTYRPNAKYLPLLKEFLMKNLPNLRIQTLDCQKDEEKMGRLKDQQRKKKAAGKQITYLQNTSNSSISSSDEEDLAAAESGQSKKTLGHNIKNPKQALIGVMEEAAGPTSANDPVESKKVDKSNSSKRATEHDDDEGNAPTES